MDIRPVVRRATAVAEPTSAEHLYDGRRARNGPSGSWPRPVT